MSRLITLYPATWRHRYEDEFLDLLQTRPPGVRDRVDIILGAVDAHLRGARGPGLIPDPAWKAVTLGFGAFLATIVIAANGRVEHDEFGTYVDGGAAIVPFAIALTLLVAGLVPVIYRLPARSTRGRRAGWTAVATGPLWALMPWIGPIGFVFFLGLAILTIEARLAGIWPRWSVLAIGLLIALPAGVFAAAPFLPWYAMRVSGLHPALFLVPFGALWPVVALLLRRGLPPLEPAAT